MTVRGDSVGGAKGIEKFLNKIIHGDCLEVMPEIPDKSVDMILADLPYGTTACKWDTVIPFEPLWEQYERIIKDNGAIVLFGSQPFTSALVMSNLKMFKYEWVWKKSRAANGVIARYQPLKVHENILIFGKGRTTYNPQDVIEVNRIARQGRRNSEIKRDRKRAGIYTQRYTNYPKSILEFKSVGKTTHPTQKPVALLEYLIKTYTNKGEIVLDNVIGSGSTAIAAINTGRFFIGIEKEQKYVEIARKRIDEAFQKTNDTPR